ncbi:hypothetical protein C0992_012701 [Termitomyces sp. T32_za158]|nr:hypothetical protein C0992_012701 [Termitomyces sp. T32_za158]
MSLSASYKKWDKLELSDDSDIEGHPNVDKKSLIRWKQRDIHEKRELRKHTIAHLKAQIACNSVLLPRITHIAATLADPAPPIPPTAYFNSSVERLEKNPSCDCPPGNNPDKLEQTYDGMLLALLRKVGDDARTKVKEANTLDSERDEKVAKYLASGMAEHVTRLRETIDNDTAKLAEEEKEQKKHITSEDLHDGFASKYIPPLPEPEPIPHAKFDKGKGKTQTTTEYEVLNPNAVSSTSAAASADKDEDEDEDEDEETLPDLTPSLEAFSKIPVRGYEKSFEFIQSHRDVIVPGASDALLVAAFRAQSAGKTKYAKQCVHQSLLLQYCEKLGPDGVRLFFRKMVSGDPRAETVFVNDMEGTYQHLVERVNVSLKEQSEASGKEQIQLVPENPNQSISFNVPDGPPPENLVLEGPQTEGLDIEEVRKALQFRWDVFEAFPTDLKDALKQGTLDAVNKVLGDMDVATAESIVQQLDMAGIVSLTIGILQKYRGSNEYWMLLMDIQRRDRERALLEWAITSQDKSLPTVEEMTANSDVQISARTKSMKQEMEELARWLEEDHAIQDDPWKSAVSTGEMTMAPAVMDHCGKSVGAMETNFGFDDDFTVFVSAPATNPIGNSGSSTPDVHIDGLSPTGPYLYRTLGSVSDLGGSEDGKDVEVNDIDDELPSKEEVRATSARIFGTSKLPLLPVTESDTNTVKILDTQEINPSMTAAAKSLSDDDLDAFASENSGADEDGSYDMVPFDLSKVLGALQEMKAEIANMEDESERRRAAARVALGLVYGLEADAE